MTDREGITWSYGESKIIHSMLVCKLGRVVCLLPGLGGLWVFLGMSLAIEASLGGPMFSLDWMAGILYSLIYIGVRFESKYILLNE